MNLTFHVMRLAILWRAQLDRALRPEGMTLAAMRPMAYLMLRTAPMNQKDLAACMGLDSSALVRILDSLEADGLLFRQSDPQDRRSKFIVLTTAGRKKCQQFHHIAAQVEAELTSFIKTGQKTEVASVLATMEARLSPHCVLPSDPS
ncbi:MarR family winged helix-turn-helix transcriptional regulator [Gluconobacter morbifer]|nr:MarR family transcriptional regulator [Gluconobacter morbifer]